MEFLKHLGSNSSLTLLLLFSLIILLLEHKMSEFNLDSLLDGTLDALADLPEFKPFPAGTYRSRKGRKED